VLIVINYRQASFLEQAPMLRSSSDSASYCYEQARECAEKARSADTEELRTDYLALEKNWLMLGRSYQFSERLTDFAAEAKRCKSELRKVEHRCPRCNLTGIVLISGASEDIDLPPHFRLAHSAVQSPDGKAKIRCRCDQMFDL
jgi:hypothetical protein